MQFLLVKFFLLEINMKNLLFSQISDFIVFCFVSRPFLNKTVEIEQKWSETIFQI